MLKVATITHLFPNPAQPILGIFVLHRVKAMARYLEVDVIAPVGWLPGGAKGRPRKVPKVRVDGQIVIHHPRYLSPTIMKPTEPFFFFTSMFPTFLTMHKLKRFNVLDTHFAFPDAPAVYALSRFLRLPFIVTVRGEDVYGHPKFPLRRLQIQRALKFAARIVCLSEVTRQSCISLGVPSDKIVLIPNGVDDQVFKPVERHFARRILGIEDFNPILLSAGWLIPRKGYHYVIQALPRLQEKFPKISYVIVGGDTVTGEYKRYLLRLAQELRVDNCLLFIDAQPQEQLALWMSAADVFCFPSEKEGWGNVVLEALSCGTPVVAHDVGGVQKMIIEGVNGFVISEKSPDVWFEVLKECLKCNWNRRQIHDSVAHWRWDRVGKQVAELMEGVWNEHECGANCRV